jgi:hypothetical protein
MAQAAMGPVMIVIHPPIIPGRVTPHRSRTDSWRSISKKDRPKKAAKEKSVKSGINQMTMEAAGAVKPWRSERRISCCGQLL